MGTQRLKPMHKWRGPHASRKARVKRFAKQNRKHRKLGVSEDFGLAASHRPLFDPERSA